MTSPFSEYMEWAKTRSAARFNLASSGVAAFPLADLGARLEDLEICGDSAYGYAPLQERLARKAGVDPDRVVHATGTSMANLLVLAAAAEPGDEVLIEEPTYSLLVDAARDRVAARARAILEANANGVNAFLAARSDLECARVDAGMIPFPRLLRGDVETLADRLRQGYETTVVPGRFFGAPAHFRMALGGAPETLEGGLARLATVLDEAGGGSHGAGLKPPAALV